MLEFISNDDRCPYYADKISSFRYMQLEKSIKIDVYNLLLQGGWRRFGKLLFLPICKSCNECISIRYIVDKHEFSKNTKRIFKKNSDLEVLVKKPTVSDEKIALYNKFHKNMVQKKDWSTSITNESSYYDMFVDGSDNDYAYEVSFLLDGRLIALSYFDLLKDRGISSIYFVYDHEYEKRSLGVYSILKQFSIAKELDVPYIYPGYWIEGHGSMGYKNRYKPFEYLENRPKINEKPFWKLWS